MENTNEMTIIFDSYSSNEAFARVAVAAFMTSLNPTVEEVADVKTAVSEAVTNAIIHGYESRIEKITLRCKTYGSWLVPLAGLFGGIFVGCWAMALTEMLDLFPIFIRRIRLVRGIGAIIIGIAFGKGLGALLFFWKRW